VADSVVATKAGVVLFRKWHRYSWVCASRRDAPAGGQDEVVTIVPTDRKRPLRSSGVSGLAVENRRP